MDAYLAGLHAQEGSPAHTLYIWIETLHERMNLLVDEFTGGDWKHDYSIDSLRELEEELVEQGLDDGTHAQGLFMECLAGYVGEVLLDEGGGRWVWDADAGSVGLPAIQPDPVLGLEPIVPILLVGQAAYEKTESIFATVALRLRKAVIERKKAEPGWKPDRVPTPWVQFDELEAFRHTWKYWPPDRFRDYHDWWAKKAGGGRKRWNFTPDSLDALEELLRDRLGTVEAYDRVAHRPFWVVVAWYLGEYVVRRKEASWQMRYVNPEAPPGTWYAEDSYWTGSIYVTQPLRYEGWSEHPAEMIRAVLRGESVRDVVDKFPDPGEEHRPGGRPRWRTSGEPWPEILWPLVAPEHLPPPLTDEQRQELADELRELEADPELKEPGWHHNLRLRAYLAERREAFPAWAEEAGGGVEAWDFSPESLDRLGVLIRERFSTSEDFVAAQHEPFVRGAGWYLGEVQVIHRDAHWKLRPEPDECDDHDEPTVTERNWDERDFDSEDDEFEERDEDLDEDAGDDEGDDDEGYVCEPVGHLCDLLARNNPEERLSAVLDNYRTRASGRDSTGSALSVAGVSLPAGVAAAGSTGDAMSDTTRDTTRDTAHETAHGTARETEPCVTAAKYGSEARGAEEVVPKMGSRATLTLQFPPFPEPDADADVGAGAGTGEGAEEDGQRSVDVSRTPHDPERARQFVAALGTVEAVVEELPSVSLQDFPDPETRADLDRVAVGCWGNVVHIIEPALGSDLLTEALTSEIDRQRTQHPEARIVGSVEMDYGNSYLQDAVILPDGEEVIAGGWDCDDDWEIVGDAAAVLRKLGVDPARAEEAGFDLDEEPSQRDWSALGSLALGGDGYQASSFGEKVSVFHVRRTESAEFNLDEVWFCE
ncbi:DUF6333 family protein [Streptomyces cavernicola]|uniref:DUF6333 family protein n=1 Tax=Streptomyces cavernicola TaxID=3043613 RepID=A0ABT6SBG8_9ACTN|nr:DUF6333 family protein [Streptomyces sp. B-S-A6]MDI3405254.1 DUF6333 family protein [Streptomyces sp. B-S-A6]